MEVCTLKKIVSLAIVAMLLISIMSLSVSAVIWSDYGIALEDNTGNTMYYELGVGQNRVRAETGVNVSNTYTVSTDLSVWDTNDTQRAAFDDGDESTTTRYVEIIYNSTDIYDIIYRVRSTHMAKYNGSSVGWETLRKQYNASTDSWSNFSW